MKRLSVSTIFKYNKKEQERHVKKPCFTSGQGFFEIASLARLISPIRKIGDFFTKFNMSKNVT